MFPRKWTCFRFLTSERVESYRRLPQTCTNGQIKKMIRQAKSERRFHHFLARKHLSRSVSFLVKKLVQKASNLSPCFHKQKTQGKRILTFYSNKLLNRPRVIVKQSKTTLITIRSIAASSQSAESRSRVARGGEPVERDVTYRVFR